MEFRIRYGILYGEVYGTSQNLEGVAVWIPFEKIEMTIFRLIRAKGFSLYFRLNDEIFSRLNYIENYILSIHKNLANFPHWYLSPIGVAKEFQGKGYASDLLRYMFMRIDQENLPCYLETQNEKNICIYEHFGFIIIEESVIPGTNITHWAMLREK